MQLGPHLCETEFTLPKDVLCKIWLKLVRRRSRQCISTMFYYPPLTKGGALHLNKLESSSLRKVSCHGQT